VAWCGCFIFLLCSSRILSGSRGHSEFANCLQIVDERTVAVFPNQLQMNEIEHIAWQLSCNFQRSRHPLYHQAMNRLHRPSISASNTTIREHRHEDHKVLMHVPAPTAVHISILKIQSKTEHN
jgi:hypothetical protein